MTEMEDGAQLVERLLCDVYNTDVEKGLYTMECRRVGCHTKYKTRKPHLTQLVYCTSPLATLPILVVYACVHRGPNVLRFEPGHSCGCIGQSVYPCAKHGECTVGNFMIPQVKPKICMRCEDREPDEPTVD